MYESSNGPDSKNCVIIYYADDTVILGLLGKSDDYIDNFYTTEIERFNDWCKVYFPDFIVKKK